jgi:hypothetical protein
MHEPLSPYQLRRAGLDHFRIRHIRQLRADAGDQYSFMLGGLPGFPNAEAMNGGILGLICVISHRLVTYITVQRVESSGVGNSLRG